MSYLPSPTYNPVVSPVPVLDASSGDPTAKKDPKSVASIGANIQAMQDQAAADRAFDAPVKEGFTNVNPSGFGKPEGFSGFSAYTTPWITNSQACKRIQGFTDMNMKPKPLPYLAAAIAFSAAALILSSFL
jgi:hypothetical protein